MYILNHLIVFSYWKYYCVEGVLFVICVYNTETNTSLNTVSVLKKLYTLKISNADPSYEDIYISHKMGVYLHMLLLFIF